MMDAFVKSIAWHDMVFAMTGRGEIWRVWFLAEYRGGPAMEKLFGNEEEFREPIRDLLRFDTIAYLAEKAAAAGLPVSEPRYGVNSDARTFLISKNGWTAAISISGLEEFQNASDAAMRDLLDTRFENALKLLEKTGDAPT